MTDIEKTAHSMIILWDDGDIKEQGAYHWAGLAYDEDDAEIEARTAMLNQKIDELRLTGDEAIEFAENAGDPANFGGSVASWTGGVNIWAAAELKKAVEDLLSEIEATTEWENALTGDDDMLMGTVDDVRTVLAKATCQE